MQAFSLIAVRMRNGKWKVKVMGHADCHFDSWCGENARIRTAPGQPNAGYESIDDALMYAAKEFPTFNSLVKWGESVGDGKWTDGSEYEGSVPADCHWPTFAATHCDLTSLEKSGCFSDTISTIYQLSLGEPSTTITRKQLGWLPWELPK